MSLLDYDYCVVGGGHNGLVAAIILQRAGSRVCLIEANQKVGGACRQSLCRGLRVSWGANFLFMLSKQVIAATGLCLSALDLKMAKEEFFPIFASDTSGAQALGKQNNLAYFFDASDSTLATFLRERDLAAGVFGDQLIKSKPLRLDLIRELERLELSSGTLFATGSITDLLEHYFPGDVRLQALLTTGKVLSMYPPSRPGTAISFLYLASANADDFGAWSVPKGGMSAVTEQLQEIFEEQGGAILLGSAAKGLHWNGTRISRLETSTGLEFSADTFVLLTSPTEVLRLLGDRVPDSERQALDDAWKSSLHDGGCSKISIVSGKPLVFHGVDQSVLSSTMIVRCLNLREWEIAYIDALKNGHSHQPYIEIFSQTEFLDSESGGPFVYSGYLMFSSYTRLLSMTSDERRDAKRQLFDAVVSMTQNPEDVIFWDAMDPIDLETEFGLIRGNVDHGIFEFDNSLEKRQSIHSESCGSNLVIAGSGFIGGGLVSGVPGLLAARDALKFF